eukprot:6081342-Amphidinium_carterae.1
MARFPFEGAKAHVQSTMHGLVQEIEAEMQAQKRSLAARQLEVDRLLEDLAMCASVSYAVQIHKDLHRSINYSEKISEKYVEITLQHCPSTDYFQIGQNYSMKFSMN